MCSPNLILRHPRRRHVGARHPPPRRDAWSAADRAGRALNPELGVKTSQSRWVHAALLSTTPELRVSLAPCQSTPVLRAPVADSPCHPPPSPATIGTSALSSQPHHSGRTPDTLTGLLNADSAHSRHRHEERADARHPVAPRDNRPLRDFGPARRRNRRGQGALRRLHPPRQRPLRPPVRQAVAVCDAPASCSRASCSATSVARSRAR